MFNLDELQTQVQAFIQEGNDHQAKELLTLIPVLEQFIAKIPAKTFKPTMEIRWFEALGERYPWGYFSWPSRPIARVDCQDLRRGYSWTTEIVKFEMAVWQNGLVVATKSIGHEDPRHCCFKPAGAWSAEVLEFLTAYFTLDPVNKENEV